MIRQSRYNIIMLPDRHSIRLPEYDYTQPGAYFVTLVTSQRTNHFGDIFKGQMQISSLGIIVEQEWRKLPQRFPGVELDEFVVMPNHFHGILWIHKSGSGETARPENENTPYLKPGSLGAIIGTFKSTCTRLIHLHLKNSGEPLWQRNYYEHIIRNPLELTRIRKYIQENPSR